MTTTDNLAVLSKVSLRRPLDTKTGQLPPGAVGTVVRFDPQARTYEVDEYFSPFTRPSRLTPTRFQIVLPMYHIIGLGPNC
jgi:hypothetical protein